MILRRTHGESGVNKFGQLRFLHERPVESERRDGGSHQNGTQMKMRRDFFAGKARISDRPDNRPGLNLRPNGNEELRR